MLPLCALAFGTDIMKNQSGAGKERHRENQYAAVAKEGLRQQKDNRICDRIQKPIIFPWKEYGVEHNGV